MGNRATGDRLEHIVGFERAKMGLALTLLSPFVPLLFQGEEVRRVDPVSEGRIVRSGDKSLALELEETGYTGMNGLVEAAR